MIFQPSGGAGSGEGLTVYKGVLSNADPNVTFETPVKLVFASYSSNYDDIPLWSIISRGESKEIYGLVTDTWPPEYQSYLSLSNDGKTLSTSSGINKYYLYYAIG